MNNPRIKFKYEKNHMLPLCLAVVSLPAMGFALFNEYTAVGPLLYVLVLFSFYPIALLLMIEFIWGVYYVFAGGSFVDLELRRRKGKEYWKLWPHIVGVLFCAISIILMFGLAGTKFNVL